MMKRNEIRNIIREELRLLNESNMSGAIYHFTNKFNLRSILMGNNLEMTNSIGKPAEVKHQRGRMNYASFTTVKNGGVGYAYQMDKENYIKDVRITFDARKLGSNHKIVPAQYYNATRQGDWTATSRSRKDENEVRVVSNKKTISNISKFITHIDIFIEEDEVGTILSNKIPPPLGDIHAIAKKRGISVSYFSSKKAWELGKVENDDDKFFKDSLNTNPVKTAPETPSVKGKGDKILGVVNYRYFLAAYILLERFAHKIVLQRFLDYVKDNSEGIKHYSDRIEVDEIQSFAESEAKKFRKGALEAYNSTIAKGWYIGNAIAKGGTDDFKIGTLFHSLTGALEDNVFPPVQRALYKIHAYKERYTKEREPRPDAEGIIRDPDKGFNEFVFKVMLGIKDYDQ